MKLLDLFFKRSYFAEKDFRPIFLLVGLMSCMNILAQSRKCPYCDGNGTIVKNISVSQYGVRNEVKKKCPTCGIYYYPSSGHSHIHCKYCRGTGVINNYGSSGNDYGSGSHSYDYEAETNPALKAWGQSMALTIRYGLPVSKEEDAAFKSFAQTNQAWAKKYVDWRNTLNNGTIYFNESSAKLGYEPVKSVDNFFNNINNQLLQHTQGITLPQDLYQEAHKLEQIFYNAYQKYRSWCSKKESLNNLEDAVLDWRLNQLLLGF